jgi:hypothetical protein
VRIVGGKHHRAIERHAVREAEEGVPDVVEALVEVEVLEVDVRHDRDRRREEEEGAVALVRPATRKGPRPSRAFAPTASSRPPTMTVGSRSPRARISPTIEVVVVFRARRRRPPTP